MGCHRGRCSPASTAPPRSRVGSGGMACGDQETLQFGSSGRVTSPHPCPPPADPDDQYKLTEDTRQLGLVVCRGTSVVLICPQDGMEAIPNPFIQQQEA